MPGLSSRRGCLCGSSLLGSVGMVFGQVVTLWEQRDLGGAQPGDLGRAAGTQGMAASWARIEIEFPFGRWAIIAQRVPR